MKKSNYIEMVAVMHQMFCLENNIDMNVILGMWEVLLSSYGIETNNLEGWDDSIDMFYHEDTDEVETYLGFLESINSKANENFDTFTETCDEFFFQINNVKIIQEKQVARAKRAA